MDDITMHDGFDISARRHPAYRIITCPSADQLGTFGIAGNAA